MINKDILQGFMFETASVRGMIVNLEESFQTILSQHTYPPAIKQILGEMLVAVALLMASIKFKGRMTIQFQGKKNIKFLVAQCHSSLKLRGLARWKGHLDPGSLLAELQEGMITILMDPEIPGGNRYQGVVTWKGDSFAESIENYFKTSEQIATRIWLSVNTHKAAGLLVQMMPGEATKLGKNPLGDSDWEHIVSLTQTITPNELVNLSPETVLRRLYSLESMRLFESKPIAFGCTCSLKKSENALKLLGPEEAEDELNQKQQIVVKCEFCNQEYVFDRIDVAAIFKQNTKPNGSDQMH